jgi:hypothetical protein
VAYVYRETNVKGRPSSEPRWAIHACFDAVDDTTITNWMIDPAKQFDGKITLYRIDQATKLKEIEFKKSYCVYLGDIFIVDRAYAICEILIVGKDIQVNTASVQGNWPE